MGHGAFTLVALMAVTAGLSAAPPKHPVKIALIVEATVDDKGWCQAMFDAIRAVQSEYGKNLVEFSYSEKMKPVDAGSAARQYASKHFDLIICHGAQYKNLVNEMAPDYPGTSFVFGTSADLGGPNVFTYMPESEQTGYLNGIIAGMLTRSNIVGLVGPVDGGDAARYDRGFKLGVLSVNPKATVNVAHTGSFSDFVKASELAKTDIKAGADILTGSSQQSMGALRAVAEFKDQAIWWVGQDQSQFNGPESYKVLAAASYNYTAVVKALLDRKEAGIKGHENIPLTFGNHGFVYKFNDKADPKAMDRKTRKAVEKAVEKAQAELTSGQLKLDWKVVKF